MTLDAFDGFDTLSTSAGLDAGSPNPSLILVRPTRLGLILVRPTRLVCRGPQSLKGHLHGFRQQKCYSSSAYINVALSLEGVSQMAYILPERLLALVRPAFDLVLRRIPSLKRCVQACGCKIMTPRYAVWQNAQQLPLFLQGEPPGPLAWHGV